MAALLLDTHAFIWWLAGHPSLSPAARTAIGTAATSVYVSAASAWELATKHRIGKLPGVASIVVDIEGTTRGNGFSSLPVSVRHAQMAGGLPGPHNDPFDRMLIAQAMSESLVLVSNEAVFDLYGVARLW